MAALPAEYRHEPALALAGGDDGMDLVRRIVAGAAAHLSDDGVLVLEIGNERAPFRSGIPPPRGGLAGHQRRRRPGAAGDARRAAALDPAAGGTRDDHHQRRDAAPRHQGRARLDQRDAAARRKDRPGRPQRRRQVEPVRAAHRQAAKRRRRCLDAAALADRRGRADRCPRPTSRRPISCSRATSG